MTTVPPEVELCCLLLGVEPPSVFTTTIGTNVLIGSLKLRIWETNKNDLQNFDARHLTLWELTPPLHTGNTAEEQKQFRSRIEEISFPAPDSDAAVDGNGTLRVLGTTSRVLGAAQRLFAQPEFHSLHLHILVQVPSEDGQGIYVQHSN